jgi:hypothetical protein
MAFSRSTTKRMLLLASLLPSSLCVPVSLSASGLITLTANCYEYDIPVTTEINAVTWNLPEFSDNYDVAGFFNNLSRRDASTAFNPISGPSNATSTGNFSISATFCSPKTSNGHEKTILLLTHGFGFDSRQVLSSFDWEDLATDRKQDTGHQR